jgi:hypothetical protein
MKVSYFKCINEYVGGRKSILILNVWVNRWMGVSGINR